MINLSIRLFTALVVMLAANYLLAQSNPPPLTKLVIPANQEFVLETDLKTHILDCDTLIMGNGARLVIPKSVLNLKIVSRYTKLGDECRIVCLNDVKGKNGKSYGSKRPNQANPGARGTNGASGGKGNRGSFNTNVLLNLVIAEISGSGLIVQSHGGNGGDGGKGQDGGHGGRAKCNGLRHGGDGGNGGTGGDSGIGGNGGHLILLYSWTDGIAKPVKIEHRAKRGKSGYKGAGGKYGNGGPGKKCGFVRRGGGAKGKAGKSGIKRRKGYNGIMKRYFGNDESIAQEAMGQLMPAFSTN